MAPDRRQILLDPVVGERLDQHHRAVGTKRLGHDDGRMAMSTTDIGDTGAGSQVAVRSAR